jgi:hypothetical protein
MALRLDVATPAWEQLRAADSSSGWDTTGAGGSYFPNGKPAPRHTYPDIWYVPELNRVMVGGTFWGSSAYNTPPMHDGFNLTTLDWDAQGANQSKATSTFASVRDPVSGVLYTTQGSKFVPTASAGSRWQSFTLSGSPNVNRMGTAFDTLRQRLYHLSAGDNYGSQSSTISSATISIATGVKTAISLTGSGLSDFQSNASGFLTSTLVYDDYLDCFYFYNGGTGQTAKIYRITPNATTTWDVSVVSVTGLTPPVSFSASVGGVLTKFWYVSRWRACVLVCGGYNVNYIRMS